MVQFLRDDEMQQDVARGVRCVASCILRARMTEQSQMECNAQAQHTRKHNCREHVGHETPSTDCRIIPASRSRSATAHYLGSYKKDAPSHGRVICQGPNLGPPPRPISRPRFCYKFWPRFWNRGLVSKMGPAFFKNVQIHCDFWYQIRYPFLGTPHFWAPNMVPIFGYLLINIIGTPQMNIRFGTQKWDPEIGPRNPENLEPFLGTF